MPASKKKKSFRPVKRLSALTKEQPWGLSIKNERQYLQ
jgi:hypothetical protein